MGLSYNYPRAWQYNRRTLHPHKNCRDLFTWQKAPAIANLVKHSHVIPCHPMSTKQNSNATGWSSCNSFTCNSFTCYPVSVTVAAIAQVETLEEAWKHFRILWILLCFLSCFHTGSGPYGPRLFKTATYRGFSAATVPAMVKGSHQQSLKQCLINHQKVKIWIWPHIPHMSSYLVRQVSDHPYNGICIPNKMVSTLFPPCPAFKTSLSRCSRSCARPLSQACSCFNVGWGPGGKDHGWSIVAQHGPDMLSIFSKLL